MRRKGRRWTEERNGGKRKNISEESKDEGRSVVRDIQMELE